MSANRLLGICVFTCGFVVVASFCIHFINPILQVTSNDLLKIRPSGLFLFDNPSMIDVAL